MLGGELRVPHISPGRAVALVVVIGGTLVALSVHSQSDLEWMRRLMSHARPPTTSTTSTTTSGVTTTTSTRLSPLFYDDTPWLEHWGLKEQYPHGRLPRVLIFNWCTEDIRIQFVNAIYWLSCYAHAHGFDIVLDSSGTKKTPVNVTGAGPVNFFGQDKEDHTQHLPQGYYDDSHMWGWVPAIKKYLFSGQWDYVIYVGIDVLVNGNNFNFPIWAYDRGHDITIMDQRYSYVGFNENSVIFKPTEFSRLFLDELYEFHKGYYLQGDNGPYMEMILRTLGQEAREEGRGAYNDQCLPKVKLDMPNSKFQQERNAEALCQMIEYARCFFDTLDTLAGPYGHRKSKHIGFSPTFYADTTGTYRYSDMSDKLSLKLTPWSNCYSEIRTNWSLHPYGNCLFWHYNGPKQGRLWIHGKETYGNVFTRIIGGKCFDPSFDWQTWRLNPNTSADLFRCPDATC